MLTKGTSHRHLSSMINHPRSLPENGQENNSLLSLPQDLPRREDIVSGPGTGREIPHVLGL